MIRLDSDSKIYILSPYVRTGGPQSLHQLCDKISQNGVDAWLVYLNEKFVQNIYPQYDINILGSEQEIEDDEKNVIIIPEANYDYGYRFKYIKICIWWLSLDFYLERYLSNRITNMMYRNNVPSCIYSKRKYIKRIIEKLFFEKKRKERDISYIKKCYNFYNCEYTRRYLLMIGVTKDNISYLCGPLEKYYLDVDTSEKKENLIVYNPKKNRFYTKRIVKYLNKIKDENVRIIPLKNMTKEEILNILKRAKVYFDFGFFPGPERMPREAAMCFCNIVVAKKGSAINEVDFPIPDAAKFDIYASDIKCISNQIFRSMYKYDELKNDYNIYREKIAKQMNDFEINIKQIFEIDGGI